MNEWNSPTLIYKFTGALTLSEEIMKSYLLISNLAISLLHLLADLINARQCRLLIPFVHEYLLLFIHDQIDLQYPREDLLGPAVDLRHRELRFYSIAHLLRWYAPTAPTAVGHLHHHVLFYASTTHCYNLKLLIEKQDYRDSTFIYKPHFSTSRTVMGTITSAAGTNRDDRAYSKLPDYFRFQRISLFL